MAPFLVVLLMILVLYYTNVVVFAVLLGLSGAGALLLIDQGIPTDLALLSALLVVCVMLLAYRTARPRAWRRTFPR